jgi:predicted transcriptional regulator
MGLSKKIKTSRIGTLFQEAPSFRYCEPPTFRIVQLDRNDARQQSDDLLVLKDRLLENEPIYPGIGKWFSSKVLPGLLNSQRIAYLAFEDEIPIATAVLKLGRHSKFCHLHIHRNFRHLDLGQMFFVQMAFEARHSQADEVHFTLPESLWNEKAPFFNSFGFAAATHAKRQYRTGEEELSCSAPLQRVWEESLQKLPYLTQRFSTNGFSGSRLLLSMRPRYAERVFDRTKRVEIRKRFSPKWKGSKAVVYGSSPLGALMGEVTVSDVIPGSPNHIWEKFGDSAGCSHEEFAQYVGNTKEVCAIELSNVNPYIYPVSLSQVSHLINTPLTPPQSFLEFKDDGGPWAKAISVAGLLHNRFQKKASTTLHPHKEALAPDFDPQTSLVHIVG